MILIPISHATWCRCLVFLLTWFATARQARPDQYVERITSLETDTEARLFLYDGRDKGWARVSEDRASHGHRSLKLWFGATEAEVFGDDEEGLLPRILRGLGLSRSGPKVAVLGAGKCKLPLNWTGVDGLVFDAYNPSDQPVPLGLKVKSGLDQYDPAARLYRTTVTLPPGKWTPVRLLRKTMAGDFDPTGVIYVRMTLPRTGTLYVDNVRFVASDRPRPETKYVRLSWTADPRTTQTFLWQSRAETGKLRFGRHGQSLTITVSSESTRRFPYGHGVFHQVTLTRLAPDTCYDYKISSGDGPWTAVRTFRTTPDCDQAEFTLLAGSDTKFGRQVMAQLFGVFAKDDPRLIIYAGDAPHTGGVPAQWERWFQTIEPFAAERPVMQSTGNHELGGDPKLSSFLAYTAMPGNGVYYSFDYGPVHFVCLDTESGLYPEQLQWLEKDLAETHKPWTVAFFHRPPFSSGLVHGSDMELRSQLVPIFDRHHVNLVISGHDHLYERSKPINLSKAREAPVGSYRQGTCYVVSGGAGAGLYDARPGNWWTAALKTHVHHFCRIRVCGSTSMTLEAVNLDGRVIDSCGFQR